MLRRESQLSCCSAPPQEEMERQQMTADALGAVKAARRRLLAELKTEADALEESESGALRPELLKNELDELERKRKDANYDVEGMEVEVKRAINGKRRAEEVEGLKQNLVAKKARAREVESELAARHTALFGKLDLSTS